MSEVEVAYQDACALLGLTPLETVSRARQRAHREESLPKWLTEELLATPHARERVERWTRLGKPEADFEDLTFCGDQETRDDMRAVFLRLPAPVQYHLVHFVLVVAVGRSSLGWWWTAPALPSPGPGEERLQLIALSTAEDMESLIAHEVAHSFLERGLPRDEATAVRDRLENCKTYMQAATSWGLLSRVIHDAEHVEERASKLAASWGFKGLAADWCAQAQSARARVFREAERAGPLPGMR